MRILLGLILVLSSSVLWGQDAEDPQLVAAKAELANIQKLVEVGAAPRARLEKAQDAVADAEDAAYLRKTAYGQDLSVDQADEMVATANRRLERREKAWNEAKRLVDAAVAPATSLKSFEDDLELERSECSLAESRAALVRELSDMANAEETYMAKLSQEPAEASKMADSYSGDGIFAYATYAKVEVAYKGHFGKSMPVSAMGETAVHRSMGFDHRGRVDVAINPEQPEGVWLLDYLKSNHIPYFAFTHAVKGKATGAHIHIGPMSTRLASGG